ncbi:unnamed protein product, partial [marine sediment metagenome]
QLKFGLPRMLFNAVDFGISWQDFNPLFIAAILVTNASLWVLKKRVTIPRVYSAKYIKDISQKVPYLIFYRSDSPEFVAYSDNLLKDLGKIKYHKNISILEDRIKRSGLEYYDFLLPTYILRSCAEGKSLFFRNFCRQFIICNFDNLTTLLNEIKNLIRKSLRKRKCF